MATPVASHYAPATFRPIYGGIFAGGRMSSAGLAAEDAAVAGSMASNASALGAGPAADDAAVGGAFAMQTSVRTALIGDSLTTHLLGYNWSPVFWFNGLNGGPLQVVANAGISGNTIADMLARVDNLYSAATPGLAGLGTLGRIICRWLTNNARADQPWSSVSADVVAMIAKCKGYCTGKVIIESVPPVGPTEANYAAVNARTQEYNTQLAALCAADPARLLFIDDSANLRNPDGSQTSGYFQADGVHNDGRATWKEGVDAATLLATELSGYSSPLSTSSSDVYPTQSQWNDNHVNSGTGGTTSGGFTGTLPNGYGVGGYGSGFAGTTSIVAASGGDPNTTPWVRVTPTQVGYTGAGEAILITKALTGRSVTSVDPAVLEIMVELRFNSFDTTYFKWSRIQIMGGTSSQPIMPDLDLKMGGEVITHSSVVARIAMPRLAGGVSESGLSIRWEFATRSAFTGSMGSFDFRCLTVRG